MVGVEEKIDPNFHYFGLRQSLFFQPSGVENGVLLRSEVSKKRVVSLYEYRTKTLHLLG